MANSKASIQFHSLLSFPFKKRGELKIVLESVFKNEKKLLDKLDYIFCSDDYLLSLNQQFLNHDTLTDILTFDVSEGIGPISGEIYISVERVRENAQSFQVAFRQELARVVIHGALHLCGYGDKSPSEAKQMRAKEEEYLSRL